MKRYVVAGEGRHAPKLYVVMFSRLGRKHYKVEVAACDINGDVDEIISSGEFSSWFKAAKSFIRTYEDLDALINGRKYFNF